MRVLHCGSVPSTTVTKVREIERDMKITFLKAGGWGNAGGDRVIALHAGNLQRMGHDVTVVAVPPAPPSLKHRLLDTLRNKVHPVPSPLLFEGQGFRTTLLEKFRLPRDTDMPDADILVTTWFETAEWAQSLSPSKGKRVSFIQGYEAFDFMPIDRLDATWRLKQPKITISKWLYDLAIDKFGADDVFLVPNSVDRTQFVVIKKERSPVPSIGFLYHTLPSKGVDVCMAAVRKIAENRSELKMYTFGHGDFSPNLPENIRHEHFNDPERGSIKDIYARCDVWICGSSSEGFHLPPLEAMACGCPVVSTMVGGPLDIVVDGYNGFLVPIGDSDGLARATEAVLDMDDAAWRRLSDQAASTGADYSWEEASRRFETHLLDIARR